MIGLPRTGDARLSRRLVAAALSVAALVVACGSGGGGNSSSAPPVAGGGTTTPVPPAPVSIDYPRSVVLGLDAPQDIVYTPAASSATQAVVTTTSSSALLRAGSIVFSPPAPGQALRGPGDWWAFVPGAQWRRPDGAVDLDEDRLDHPVVQVAVADAEAYAAWAGKALPSEAEWEFAARGGLEDADYAWGGDFMPDGRRLANTWPGPFPWRGDGGEHRYGTSAVGAFPADAHGLHDMIGNVWEWTADWWTPRHREGDGPACCTARNPRVSDPSRSFDPAQPAVRIPRRVLKGGSHLCAPNYCRRYRPAARHPEMVESATTHIGFRCVMRAE